MAAFHGIQGIAAFSEADLYNFAGWSIATETDIVEVQILDSSADGPVWVTQLAGHSRWSGSFSGYMDDTSVMDLGQTGLIDRNLTATFTDGAGGTFGGSIRVRNINWDNQSTDAGKYTADFVGTSTLTRTT